MKVKTFSFKVDTRDPRPIRLSVSARAFGVEAGKIRPLRLSEREFVEDEDLLDFDMEFGDTFNIAFNDLIHGDFDVKVLEGEAKGMVLKAYTFNDSLRERRGVLFRVVDENGATIYVDNVYFSEPLEKRIGKVSRILGVTVDEVKQVLGLQ